MSWFTSKSTPAAQPVQPVQPVQAPEDYKMLKSYMLNSIASWNSGLKTQTLIDKKRGKLPDNYSGASKRKQLIDATLKDLLGMNNAGDEGLANYSATSAAKNFGSSLFSSSKSAPPAGGKKTRKRRRRKH